MTISRFWLRHVKILAVTKRQPQASEMQRKYAEANQTLSGDEIWRRPYSGYQDMVLSGLELFLSPAIRQRLARTLRVKTDILKEVEFNPQQQESLSQLQKQRKLKQVSLAIVNDIESGITDHSCPLCEEKLIIRGFTREDLQGNAFEIYKIHCSNCLFRVETD